MVSIIAGNGINYGIMYMARYIEARRDEAADVAAAIAHRPPRFVDRRRSLRLGHGGCWPTARSLITDFRGFKHFGIIGGYAMLLCWIATYVFMPAFLAASERVLPVVPPARSIQAHAAPAAIMACPSPSSACARRGPSR